MTFNDKGSIISRTYVRNISRTQIFYLCNLCKCHKKLLIMYILEVLRGKKWIIDTYGWWLLLNHVNKKDKQKWRSGNLLETRYLFAAWSKEGQGWGVFSIFPNKGFGSNFFKIVVGRKINRRGSSNSNKGRRKAWESVGWWECAHVVVATICCSSFLSPPPLRTTPSQQSMKSYSDCSCCFCWCHGT